MSRDEDIAAVRSSNMAQFIKHGPTTRAMFHYGIFVVSRDPDWGLVQLGGLGAMGAGQMWVTEQDHERGYPGYDDAPEERAPFYECWLRCRERWETENPGAPTPGLYDPHPE